MAKLGEAFVINSEIISISFFGLQRRIPIHLAIEFAKEILAQVETTKQQITCPLCQSSDVSFLAINEFNKDMYGCRNCYHTWN